MANLKISAMVPATVPLNGNEIFPLLQGGINKRATIQDILDLVGGGGGSQNFQQVLTTGSVLTTAHTVNAGANSFAWTVGGYTVDSTDEIMLKVGAFFPSLFIAPSGRIELISAEDLLLKSIVAGNGSSSIRINGNGLMEIVSTNAQGINVTSADQFLLEAIGNATIHPQGNVILNPEGELELILPTAMMINGDTGWGGGGGKLIKSVNGAPPVWGQHSIDDALLHGSTLSANRAISMSGHQLTVANGQFNIGTGGSSAVIWTVNTEVGGFQLNLKNDLATQSNDLSFPNAIGYLLADNSFVSTAGAGFVLKTTEYLSVVINGVTKKIALIN